MREKKRVPVTAMNAHGEFLNSALDASSQLYASAVLHPGKDQHARTDYETGQTPETVCTLSTT
jgi:hypothetical protein